MRDTSIILNESCKEQVFQDGTFTMVHLKTDVNGETYEGVGFSKCKRPSTHALTRLRHKKKAYERILRRIQLQYSRQVTENQDEHEARPEAANLMDDPDMLKLYILRKQIEQGLNKLDGDIFDPDRGIDIARGRAVLMIAKQAGVKLPRRRYSRRTSDACSPENTPSDEQIGSST